VNANVTVTCDECWNCYL